MLPGAALLQRLVVGRNPFRRAFLQLLDLRSAILDVAIERFMGLGPLVIDSTPVEQRLVHIDDLIQACLHVIDHPDTVGRTFNVASGVYPTSHEVAKKSQTPTVISWKTLTTSSAVECVARSSSRSYKP